MNGIPISDLPDAAVPLSGSDRIVVVQGGVTKDAPCSALPFSGLVPTNPEVLVSYQAELSDKTIFVGTANAITITIPTGFPVGHEITIQRTIAGTTNNITVSAVDTIEGASTWILPPAPIYSVYGLRKTISGAWTVQLAQVPPVVRVSADRSTALNFTTSATVIVFDREYEDTHNAYNSTTGSFTVPISGVYSVNFRAYSNAGTYALATGISALCGGSRVVGYSNFAYGTNTAGQFLGISGSWVHRWVAGEVITVFGSSYNASVPMGISSAYAVALEITRIGA